jgi:hypothetical protein
MAHPRVIAQRNQKAQDRTVAAVEILAQRFNLAPEIAAGLRSQNRDPETTQVLRREAVADLTEALVAATAPTEEDAPQPEQTDEFTGLKRGDLLKLAKDAEIPKSSQLSNEKLLEALRAKKTDL